MKTEILLAVLIVVLSLLCVVACKQEKKEDNNESKNMITKLKSNQADKFPWDERTTLVFYAGNSLEDNPDKSFPHLIVNEYNDSTNFLLVDGVPYLSVLTKEQMLDELSNYKNTKNKEDQEIIKKIEDWINIRIKESYSVFLYELEPPSMAGRAYPIAKKSETN